MERTEDRVGSDRGDGRAVFEAAFQTASVLMNICSMRDGRMIEVNDAFCAALGYDRSELIGHSAAGLGLLVDPEDRERAVSAVREHGSARDFKITFRRRDGSLLRGSFSASEIEYEGEPCLLTATVDQTERLAAEDALRTSEARYRNLFQQTADGVLVLDNDGRIVDVNPAMAEFLGRSADELRGNIWVGYVDPDNLAETPFVRPALEAGNPVVFERRIRRPDGSVVELELHARQIAQGSMLGVARDIGARKAVERERARLTRAIEQSAGSIIITDPSGTITYVNPAFEKETGFTSADVVGRNHRVLHSPDNPPDLYPLILETVLKEGIWSGEVLSATRDGSVLREAARVSAVRDSAGTLVNFVAVQRNITRERELEDQLRQAQKMEAVGHLAGGIAHDFNNLLTAVNGYAELLVTELGDSPLADDAREIGRAGARAAELTRQVLAFARRQVLEPRAVDLNVVVGGISQMLTRLIGEQVRLVTGLAPEPAVVLADPGKLEQVLVNLAVNARDAMPEGGSLAISVSLVDEAESLCALSGRAVLLTVADQGCGMDADTLEHAFEPFFTTKSAGAGTGLGLATVYGIVHQSNGEVWASSAVGEGTTVSVLLPRLDTTPDAVGVTAPRADDAAAVATILVVEDEPAVRGYVASTLERAGYRVLVAGSPAEAVTIAGATSGRIDVLVTDMVMPDLNGLALARQLVADRPTLRVVLMSGYDPSLATVPADGAFRFLAKPFGREELTGAVAHALATPQPAP
jgi:two-component system, cell cycle sensor histidine kinase and response regulator CckA